MKKKAYSDPYMELVLLNGEDIICASETAADNDAPAPFSDDGAGSESLDYSGPIELIGLIRE